VFIAASRDRLTSLQQTDMVQRADHGVVGCIIRLHRDHRYLEEIEVDHYSASVEEGARPLHARSPVPEARHGRNS